MGLAVLVELSSRDAAQSVLAGDLYQRAGLFASVEVHDWQFGGRPDA